MPAGASAADAAAQTRKRRPLSRHNSRRGLLGLLSREGSLASCSSLGQIQVAKIQRNESGEAAAAGEAQKDGERNPVCGQAAEVPSLIGAPWARGMRAVGSSSRLQ